MKTNILVTVRDRVPEIADGADVITHNSDYTLTFDFDAEWANGVKTVYFAAEDGTYRAVVMNGNSCDVPMLDGEHRRIFVGVQQGTSEKPDVLKTSRPCCLKVVDSIADYVGEQIPDPEPSVYEQIIAMLEKVTTPTWQDVAGKPFETLGDGLEVDENGVLSAPGGGGGGTVAKNAVLYTAQELTDEQQAQARANIGAKAATDKSAYIISRTRSYGKIGTFGMDFDEVHAQLKSGKVVILLVDGIITYYGAIRDTPEETIEFYNISDMSRSGGNNNGIEYYGFTWHKGDNNLTEWWGSIPHIEVDETLTQSGSAADAAVVGEGFAALNTELKNKQPKGDYLTEETDPTVPAWAKSPTKPTYTAKEVGALPDTTVIPTVPPTLPNPHKLTFTGAVTGEYDGSAEVKVDIPQGGGGSDSSLGITAATVGQIAKITAVENGVPTAWEAVDLPSGEKWEKICEKTVTVSDAVQVIEEDIQSGEIAKEYQLWIRFAANTSADWEKNGAIQITINGASIGYYVVSARLNTVYQVAAIVDFEGIHNSYVIQNSAKLDYNRTAVYSIVNIYSNQNGNKKININLAKPYAGSVEILLYGRY